MRGGIWVLNIFAAIWGVAAIVIGGLPVWLAVGPVAVSGVLLAWAGRQTVGTGNPLTGKHVGRVVGIATAVEGVAMFVAANILINMHLPTLVMPVFAMIVGLHFLPLARWIPVPLYYWTGGALVAVGWLALALPPPERAFATGMGAAIVLWVSGVVLARFGRG